MKKTLCITLFSIFSLVGCGGGSNGDDGNADLKPTQEMNGLYINQDDMTLLLVDTTRNQVPVIATDYLNDEIYLVNSGAISGDTYFGVGLHIINSFGFASDSEKKVNIIFGSDNTATLSTTDYNNNLVSYTAFKTAGSLPLSELVGSYTDPLGTEWVLNSDGSFTINGVCTISGTLDTKDHYYYAKDVSATNCQDSDYEQNDYEAVIVTAEVNGKNTLMGLMISTDNNDTVRGIWDYVIIE